MRECLCGNDYLLCAIHVSLATVKFVINNVIVIIIDLEYIIDRGLENHAHSLNIGIWPFKMSYRLRYRERSLH